MRVALGIEYDGSGYVGWQQQKTGTGVQEAVEAALAKVADAVLETVCAGRTDAGVHAAGQVAHFDTPARRSTRGWLLGANANLPEDINVTWAALVDDEFHARFSACARTYRYVLLNRLSRSALFRQRAWWVHELLDEHAMRQAANLLVGEHDFSAFRAAGCQASTPVRQLTALTVNRHGQWLTITVTANAFLKHMVRNITGSLVAIGRGEKPPGWAQAVLDSRDRTAAGVTAPPHGLTLMSVRYPEGFGVPPGGGDTPGINVYDSLL